MSFRRRPFINVAYGFLVVIVIGGIALQAIAGEQKKLRAPLAVIFSTDTIGYLEPCGCGGENSGGMARRAGALHAIAPDYQNTLILDNGNLVTSKSQCDALAESMQKIGYTAVNFGMMDLSYQDQLTQTIKDKGISIIANTTGSTSSIIKEIGGIKVGVMGFSPNLAGKRPFFQSNQVEALKELKTKTDLVVVLSQMGKPQDLELLKACPVDTISVFIGSNGWNQQTEPATINGTLVVSTMTRGRSLGIVEINPNNKKEYQLAFRQVRLRPSDFELDPEVGQIVKAYYAEEQRKVTESIKESKQKATTQSPESTPEQRLKAQIACAKCHEQQVDAWIRSPHAKALKTLKAAGKLTPECLNCHSTTYQKNKTCALDDNFPGGVECKSCHPDAHDEKAASSTKKIQGKNASRCISCHNQDRSPKFNLDSYWDQVVH